MYMYTDQWLSFKPGNHIKYFLQCWCTNEEILAVPFFYYNIKLIQYILHTLLILLLNSITEHGILSYTNKKSNTTRIFKASFKS